MYVDIYIYINIYIYIYIYTYVCVCVYIYMHTYVYWFNQLYIDMYVWWGFQKTGGGAHRSEGLGVEVVLLPPARAPVSEVESTYINKYAYASLYI